MMTEPTAEEQAEIDRINRIKDRRHQQYLRRKESGWQRKYEERVKNEKRAKMQAMKRRNPQAGQGERSLCNGRQSCIGTDDWNA